MAAPSAGSLLVDAADLPRLGVTSPREAGPDACDVTGPAQGPGDGRAAGWRSRQTCSRHALVSEGYFLSLGEMLLSRSAALRRTSWRPSPAPAVPLRSSRTISSASRAGRTCRGRT